MGLYKRKNSNMWQCRIGRNIDRSTGTRDYDRARLIEAEWRGHYESAKAQKHIPEIEAKRVERMQKYTREVLRKCASRHPYTLGEKDEQALLEQAASGVCSVTGMSFSLVRPEGGNRRPYAPSVDRIDASRPYEPGNVRLVCVCVNYALNEWGEKVLRQMALGYLKTKFIPWAADFENE